MTTKVVPAGVNTFLDQVVDVDTLVEYLGDAIISATLVPFDMTAMFSSLQEGGELRSEGQRNGASCGDTKINETQE